MKLGGCEVYITCNGIRVREVNPAVDDDSSEASCWVVSEPGKEFQIEYQQYLNYGPKDKELTIDIYFDGQNCGAWIARDPQPGEEEVFGTIEGGFGCGNKLHPFVFSNPETFEGETPSSVNPDEIGQILVQLGFAEKSEYTRVGAEQRVVGPNPTRVNEKDKKPGVHCAILGESSEECMEPVFFCTASDVLVFVFQCRGEEWLRAKGLMRPLRRKRGEPEPVRGLEVAPLPKPEPMEEVIPANEVQVASTAESLPQPLPLTPLDYIDEGQEDGSITLERPQKIPRHSGNFTFTTEEGSSGSRIRVEEVNSVSRMKVEEHSSVVGIKDGVGEVKVMIENLKAEEEELDEQISKLEKKRAKVQGKIATFQAPRTGSKTRSPQVKVKKERESTQLPLTPEVIDLTLD